MIDRTRVLQRLEQVTEYLCHLRTVAAFRRETFLADPLAIGATESYLRKSLEAIFDVGRHILAKTGHVDMAEEYESIARGLVRYGVVSQANAQPSIRYPRHRASGAGAGSVRAATAESAVGTKRALARTTTCWVAG